MDDYLYYAMSYGAVAFTLLMLTTEKIVPKSVAKRISEERPRIDCTCCGTEHGREKQYVPFDKDWWAIGLLEPEFVMESVAQNTKWIVEPPVALWSADRSEPLMLMGQKVPVDTIWEEHPVLKWVKYEP